MPLRLTLTKSSPENEAPEQHFLFEGSLGEAIPEEEVEAVGVITYDADEALDRLLQSVFPNNTGFHLAIERTYVIRR